MKWFTGSGRASVDRPLEVLDEKPGSPRPSLSAQVFGVPLEDSRYLVYAPLRGVAFVANAAAVNTMADLAESSFDPGTDSADSLVEWLRALGLVDGGPEPHPTEGRLVGDPKPTAVTLFLTTACNLRCTYCYAATGETPMKYMTFETAKRGIDFVVSNARERGADHVQVNYHGGGEPTVNWKTMTQSRAYARGSAARAGIEVTAAMATNGVLNDRQIDWVVGNLNGGASVSFDGLPEVQDTHRATIGGGGSSRQVMHTLRRFDDAGYSYGIRVTVTHDQITRLADSIEFICSQFCPQRIQVEPAYQLGRWRTAPSAETEEFIDAYREAQSRAGDYGQEIQYSAARVGVLTNHFCGITRDNFSLSADGNVSACFEAFSEDNEFADIFFYGKPAKDSGYRFDRSALEHLRSQTVEHHALCQGCFAKWNCAGDCYHKSLSVNGRGEFPGSERCHITRELVKDQLLSRIAASGGLVWHQPTDGEAYPLCQPQTGRSGPAVPEGVKT